MGRTKDWDTITELESVFELEIGRFGQCLQARTYNYGRPAYRQRNWHAALDDFRSVQKRAYCQFGLVFERPRQTAPANIIVALRFAPTWARIIERSRVGPAVVHHTWGNCPKVVPMPMPADIDSQIIMREGKSLRAMVKVHARETSVGMTKTQATMHMRKMLRVAGLLPGGRKLGTSTKARARKLRRATVDQRLLMTARAHRVTYQMHIKAPT